jgi:hypothetical protein
MKWPASCADRGVGMGQLSDLSVEECQGVLEWCFLYMIENGGN